MWYFLKVLRFYLWDKLIIEYILRKRIWIIILLFLLKWYVNLGVILFIIENKNMFFFYLMKVRKFWDGEKKKVYYV